MAVTADARMLLSILAARPTSKLMSWIKPQEHLAKIPRAGPFATSHMRRFSASVERTEKRQLQTLPPQHLPVYHGTIPTVHCSQVRHSKRTISDLPVPWIASPNSDLLFLTWSTPPQNILLVKKECAPLATEAMKEFAKYVCE